MCSADPASQFAGRIQWHSVMADINGIPNLATASWDKLLHQANVFLSQTAPGEPATSGEQCQEQPGGESGGEPGAARRATASSHQCQEQPGEPAASRSSQQPASSSYKQAKYFRSSSSQQPQPTQAMNSQEVVRSSLQQQEQQQQLDKGDRERFRIR